jgi:hypothetical protein
MPAFARFASIHILKDTRRQTEANQFLLQLAYMLRQAEQVAQPWRPSPADGSFRFLPECLWLGTSASGDEPLPCLPEPLTLFFDFGCGGQSLKVFNRDRLAPRYLCGLNKLPLLAIEQPH